MLFSRLSLNLWSSASRTRYIFVGFNVLFDALMMIIVVNALKSGHSQILGNLEMANNAFSLKVLNLLTQLSDFSLMFSELFLKLLDSTFIPLFL